MKGNWELTMQRGSEIQNPEGEQRKRSLKSKQEGAAGKKEEGAAEEIGEGPEMVFRDQSHNSWCHYAPTQMPATFAIW